MKIESEKVWMVVDQFGLFFHQTLSRSEKESPVLLPLAFMDEWGNLKKRGWSVQPFTLTHGHEVVEDGR